MDGIAESVLTYIELRKLAKSTLSFGPSNFISKYQHLQRSFYAENRKQ